MRFRVCILIVVIVVMGSVGGTGAFAQLSSGAALPSATLQRPNGEAVSTRSLTGSKGTVFLMWGTQCPWVNRYEDRVQALVSDFQKQGIRFVIVDPHAEGDAPAEKGGSPPAPYVRDPGASFATALGATRVPQAFVFNAKRTLVYKGAIDDSPSGPNRVEAPYLRNALEALVGNKPVPVAEKKAFGCALTGTK